MEILEIAMLFMVTCCMLMVGSGSNIGRTRQDISLSSNGGYSDILVVIDEKVPENPAIISKLQDYFTEASKVLLRATHDQLYFKHFTIVVPKTWTPNSAWSQPEEGQTKNKARIVIAESNSMYGDEPYIQQPGKCGQEGDFIHLTPEYLTEKSTDDRTYRPAKRIVKEFAKLKWGVFDENIPVNDKKTPPLYKKDMSYLLQGCVEGITHIYENLNTCTVPDDYLNYADGCSVVPTGLNKGTASLLAYEFLDEVVDFCTSGEGDNPHNIQSDNNQNSNCGQRSAWEVMNNLSDFDPEKKLLRQARSPLDPVFNVVQERNSTNEIGCSQDIVCICMDVSGSMSNRDRITVMSEAVQLYLLSYLRVGSAVGIVSFENSAVLHADMTEITTKHSRELLMAKVPAVAAGGTNIAAGINECRRILHKYAGSRLSSARILLHSDGEATVEEEKIDDSIQQVISEGINLDTVLFDQGGYLSERAHESGGIEYLASDINGQIGLLGFYEDTASRWCEAEQRESVLTSEEIIIPAGKSTYHGKVYFDRTIGQNTKMVFKGRSDVNLIIHVPMSLISTVTNNSALKTTIILMESVKEPVVDYSITRDNVDVQASVILTVSASPFKGVEPVVFEDRMSSRSFDFSASTELISYIGVFQGFTPVLDLNVAIILEYLGGDHLTIPHTDDGQGMDSVANDGVYTGHLAAHSIAAGSSQSYCGLTIKVSGEGMLYEEDITSRRKKRCTVRNSLGNVTRSMTGGVIVIKNWYPAPDTTPPDRITNLRVLEASEEDGLFILGWTAPGEDLNIGQVSGYSFSVGTNLSVDAMVTLRPDAILTDVSSFIVESGTHLRMHLNASKLTPAVFGLPEATNISTFYFRFRAYDSNNNYADWSNPASATFIDPAIFAALLGRTSSSPSTSSATESSTSTSYGHKSTHSWYSATSVRNGTTITVVANSTTMLIILGASLFIAGSVFFAVTVSIIVSRRRYGKMMITERESIIAETEMGQSYCNYHLDKDI